MQYKCEISMCQMLISLVTWSVYDAGMKLYVAFPKNIKFLNDGINQHCKVISLSSTL